ncbi:MAG: transglycosylase domain-containing protein, partial [Desulfarculaceae bacterium]|nr:transglycosylase domain-containing protein [Desulfarculaceae bacterium]
MTKTQSTSDIIKKRKKKSFWASFFKWSAIALIVGLLVAAGALGGLYYYISRDLPRITSLEDYAPPTVTSVFSDDGRKIGELYKQRRIVIPLEEMPKDLINAFVAAEDSRFREHPGVDIYSIFRAFLKNFKAGTIVQGGSTITQQVAKSFFLTPARTYKRKIKEAILAYRIEKHFTKDEILYLYLNQIYLGHGAYGVEAAAENYFGKHAEELNLAECSMLAGLPQAPSSYSPFRKPEKAKQRQIYVLNRLKQDGHISNLEATEAMNKKLDIKPRKNWFIERVPCYTEHVRRYVKDKYGEDMLYNEGLNIHTAVNIELQKIARKEVTKGLRDLDRRQGYRGPLQHLPALKIDEFCKKVAEEIGDESLKENKVYKGVVTGINKQENTAAVRVGDFEGVIRGKTVSWARPVNPDVGYWEDKINHVDEVFDAGDVIKVSVKSSEQTAEGTEFILEQE